MQRNYSNPGGDVSNNTNRFYSHTPVSAYNNAPQQFQHGIQGVGNDGAALNSHFFINQNAMMHDASHHFKDPRHFNDRHTMTGGNQSTSNCMEMYQSAADVSSRHASTNNPRSQRPSSGGVATAAMGNSRYQPIYQQQMNSQPVQNLSHLQQNQAHIRQYFVSQQSFMRPPTPQGIQSFPNTSPISSQNAVVQQNASLVNNIANQSITKDVKIPTTERVTDVKQISNSQLNYTFPSNQFFPNSVEEKPKDTNGTVYHFATSKQSTSQVMAARTSNHYQDLSSLSLSTASQDANKDQNINDPSRSRTVLSVSYTSSPNSVVDSSSRQETLPNRNALVQPGSQKIVRKYPKPEMTSQIPAINSQIPEMTSQIPAVDPQIPAVNLQLPVMNPQLPLMNSQIPGMTSQMRGMNSQIPGMNPQIPGMNSQIPTMDHQTPAMNSQMTSRVQQPQVSRQPTVTAVNSQAGGSQDNTPMLANPLLNMMQKQGVTPVDSNPAPAGQEFKLGQSYSAPSNNAVKKSPRKADDDDDDEEDDDDDDLEGESETSTSDDSSSASSHDYEERASCQSTSSTNVIANKSQHYHNRADVKQSTSQNSSVSRGGYGQQHQAPSAAAIESKFKKIEISNRNYADLLKERNLISEFDLEGSVPTLQGDFKRLNCPPDVMCCTMNTIPNSSKLLNQARLPFGVLLHPFKDTESLPEVSTITRCRLCRMYVNPFISLINSQKWRCNMCYRYNELPEDFLYDYKTKTYTDGRHRTELNCPVYEIKAAYENSFRKFTNDGVNVITFGHLLSDVERRPTRPGRPPISPSYVFVLDVSFNAVETGYLSVLCESILDSLDNLCSNDRTRVCFVTFSSELHFYNLHHSLAQPQVFCLADLEDIEIPCPSGLLVNLKESRVLVESLLHKLPLIHQNNKEIGNCLGTAVRMAFKILADVGGRVTIFQTKLPDVGEGALKSREDPNKRAAEDVTNLTPTTDFYRKFVLDSSFNIGCDLFLLNTQYTDFSNICTIAKFSGGGIYYFPNFHTTSNPVELDRFRNCLARYFTRHIGFEAVLRVRCTRGLSTKTIHGNGFIRGTDLIALPVVDPDAGIAVEISIDENIEDSHAYIQAVLLYTSDKNERRMRIITLCLNVSSELSDVLYNANQQATIAFVAKMAVDRSVTSSIADSREAMTNVAFDVLSAFGKVVCSSSRIRQLPCAYQLRAVPLYVLSLIKSTAFRLGVSTKLDDRVYSLEKLKTLPWPQLLLAIYPRLYPIHSLSDKNALLMDDKVICQLPSLPLSVGYLDKQGAYLLDTGAYMFLWMTPNVKKQFLKDVLGVNQFGSLVDGLVTLQNLDNPSSENVINFVDYLNSFRPIPAPLVLIRDDGRERVMFYERLIEDRTSDVSNMSYVEFVRLLYDKLSAD